MTDLDSLIERLEKASVPDRELDAAIVVATTPARATPDDLITLRLPHKSDRCAPGTYWLCQRSGMSLQSSALFTASVDAALALVERMLPWAWVRMDEWQDIGASPVATILVKPTPSNPFTATGATLPLALLIALLRALKEQDNG